MRSCIFKVDFISNFSACQTDFKRGCQMAQDNFRLNLMGKLALLLLLLKFYLCFCFRIDRFTDIRLSSFRFTCSYIYLLFSNVPHFIINFLDFIRCFLNKISKVRIINLKIKLFRKSLAGDTESSSCFF